MVFRGGGDRAIICLGDKQMGVRHMRSANKSRVAASWIAALLVLGASPASHAARLYENRDVGRLTCSRQLGSCIAYSRNYRTTGSERQCVVVWKMCMRTGVWDGKDAFAYGGALMSGMIRR